MVTTFRYQLTHDEKPRIEIDGELKTHFFVELADIIVERVLEKEHIDH